MRLYNRALSASRDPAGHGQLDHAERHAAPERARQPDRDGALTSAALSWSAASDNVGVVRYNVHRGTSPGFTPSAANRIGQPSGTSYSDSGLAAGTYYYKVTAEDAAGNVGPVSNEASAVVGDTTPPSAPGTLSATGAVGKATLSWGAASDNVAVVRYNVYRSTTPGFTPAAGNRIAQPSGTGYTDTAPPGTYYYKVQAEDAAGNIGPASNEASALVSADTSPPSAPANLAASVSGGTVNLSWSASSDDVGVVRYNLHRGTSAGFTPSAAQPDRPADGDELRGHEHLHARHLLLQSDGGGCCRQRERALQRGLGDDRRHDSAERPERARGERRRHDRFAHVERGHRQRGRRALQPPPLDHARVHARARRTGSPSPPARATATAGSAPALLLQGHRRGRCGQRRPGFQRGRSDNRGHHSANGSGRADGNGRGRPGGALVDGVHRQRRRSPLQRPPLDHLRLHAERRQPDRAAERHELHRRRPRGGHLLLQGDRRGRRRQHQLPEQPGKRDRHRRRAERPRRRLRLRRGQRHDDRRPLRKQQHRARSRTRPGRRPGSSATHSSSTARTHASTSTTRTRST